jgi:hypothetical protein
MPGLVPGIHALLSGDEVRKAWMAGTSPAMTHWESSGAMIHFREDWFVKPADLRVSPTAHSVKFRVREE